MACGLESDGTDSASAADTATPVPVTTDNLLGAWETAGADALMQNVVVKNWSGAPLVTADVPYSNLTFHGVDFVMKSLDDPTTTTFVGASSLRVSWGGVHCSYPIDLVVLVSRDTDGRLQMYMRDNRPVAIPDSLPSAAETCPPLTNTWRTHPDAYKKKTPVKEFNTRVDALCASVTSRLAAVDAAKRLTTGAMGAVPANIYQASGDWQAQSTPGRDTTLRGQVRDIDQFVSDGTQGSDAHDNAVLLQAAWADRSAACHIAYNASNGAPVPLALGDFVKRAYKISFDPYHCPELRWGADASAGAEFSTCNTQDDAHVKRYNDEQSLRNYVDRPAGGTTTPLGSGPQTPTDIDFVARIQRLAQ
jgi:hypothetical protein